MSFILTLLILVGVPFAWYVTSRNAYRNNSTSKSIRNISALAGVSIGMFALMQFFTIIPAGHVGVMDLFGHLSKRTLQAGINLVNPFMCVTKFPIRTEENKGNIQELPCRELTLGLEIRAVYRLNPDSYARVNNTVAGGDYETRIHIPEFCSVRASFQTSTLYSTEQDRLGMAIQDELATRGIIIETTPLCNAALPFQLADAIVQKPLESALANNVKNSHFHRF